MIFEPRSASRFFGHVLFGKSGLPSKKTHLRKVSFLGFLVQCKFMFYFHWCLHCFKSQGKHVVSSFASHNCTTVWTDELLSESWLWEYRKGSSQLREGQRHVRVSPLQASYYPDLCDPPFRRIPVNLWVSLSHCTPSIQAGGDSITSWWKAMEKQLGIQGRASAMHGCMVRCRQAICCDEEALWPACLRPLGSPSSPA